MEEKLDLIIEKLNEMERRIAGIEKKLEDETNRNIRSIAGECAEKLDQAIRAQNRLELAKVRIDILENELNKLKTSLNEA